MIDRSLDLDELISRLLKSGGETEMSENELTALCSISREVIRNQPMLLELEAPMNVCGDIHGQIADLRQIFETCGSPAEQPYLFLGDYVDRGKNSLETIALLLAYKVKFPLTFFLLRGNHESASINRIYGFYDECQRRFSLRLWKLFTETFNYLPVAALIDGRILCMHGGLSPDLRNVASIKRLLRPTDIPDAGVLCDLLWSDPEEGLRGWAPNDRGVSYIFGADVLSDFMKKNGLDLICRAHQVVEQGYEFFHNRSLVTVFSAPNYCGEFDNDGAVMCANEDLVCSFKIIKAKKEKPRGNSKKNLGKVFF